ncbi:MAG: helix-turn-helix transcriptional regulator [Candidatus Thermoplasmatota archaeon]|nr:helix-turn-helix transcriptional regulator [Candidatus Thermoplasmatota archaeon]MCL5955167.1 helix-turn-helix transcriptional regulator [Candidatus Thermoplasmatota archaeon]
MVESKPAEELTHESPIAETCPIVNAIREIGGEWKLIVIRYLAEGKQGFNELMKTIPDVNSKTLAATLKYLEEKNIINREVESTRPFRVKYSLTEKGISLGEAITDLKKWGEQWVGKTKPVKSAEAMGHA